MFLKKPTIMNDAKSTELQATKRTYLGAPNCNIVIILITELKENDFWNTNYTHVTKFVGM